LLQYVREKKSYGFKSDKKVVFATESQIIFYNLYGRLLREYTCVCGNRKKFAADSQMESFDNFGKRIKI